MTLQLLYLKVFGLSRNDSNMTTWGGGGVGGEGVNYLLLWDFR